MVSFQDGPSLLFPFSCSFAGGAHDWVVNECDKVPTFDGSLRSLAATRVVGQSIDVRGLDSGTHVAVTSGGQCEQGGPPYRRTDSRKYRLGTLTYGYSGRLRKLTHKHLGKLKHDTASVATPSCRVRRRRGESSANVGSGHAVVSGTPKPPSSQLPGSQRPWAGRGFRSWSRVARPRAARSARLGRTSAVWR